MIPFPCTYGKRVSFAHKLTAVILALFLLAPSARAAHAPGDSALCSILYEAQTGTVLYSKNPDTPRLIASVTKVMTAVVVLENCDPGEEVTIKPEWANVEGSSMYVVPGDTYTVKELLYGMIIVSGNDAATALACHCAGSVMAFADMMNAKAAELAMTGSSFENPHGLDGKNQYSTARDIAKLTVYAMKNPVFAEICATKKVTVHGVTLYNHNKLLDMYEGVVGVKTGYTEAAGRTLVSCAHVDGMSLICVTLCDGSDWKDHMALFDWARSSYELVEAVTQQKEIRKVPVISGTREQLPVAPERSSRLLVKKGQKVSVEASLRHFVYAPMTKGSKAGTAYITVDRKVADTVDLVYAEDAELDMSVPLTCWERIKWAWYRANEYSSYNWIYPGV